MPPHAGSQKERGRERERLVRARECVRESKREKERERERERENARQTDEESKTG
jgi:hypothetical protein